MRNGALGSITGRDAYIIAEALATALVALEQLPPATNTQYCGYEDGAEQPLFALRCFDSSHDGQMAIHAKSSSAGRHKII